MNVDPDIGLAVATCEKYQIRLQNKQLRAAYFYFMQLENKYVRYDIFMLLCALDFFGKDNLIPDQEKIRKSFVSKQGLYMLCL